MKAKFSLFTNPIHTIPFSFRLQSVLEFLTLIYTNSYSRILHLKAFMNSYGYGIKSSGTQKSRFSFLNGLKNRLPKNNWDWGKVLRYGFPVIIVLVIASVFYQFFSQDSSRTVEGAQRELSEPLATQTVGREFSFPLRDETGEEVENFQYVVTDAEIQEEIVVKGSRARAVSGRQFVILKLKIVNHLSDDLQIETRDYVRLSVPGSDERLAPDIHNDPLEVQGESTKYTRVGFVTDEEIREFDLRIGEIGGERESIELHLK